MIQDLFDKDDITRKLKFLTYFEKFQELLNDEEKPGINTIYNEDHKQNHKKQESIGNEIISQDDAIKIGDNFLYDFDFFPLGNNTLICFIIENKYLLYNLEVSTKKVTKLKDCELRIPSDNQEIQESLYRVKFFEIYNENGVSSNNDIKVSQESDLSLLMAGKNGVIYLINIEKDFKIEYLLGHYTDIYDIALPRANKLFQNLFLSCSKDRSILLWNAAKNIKIAHFRDEFQLHTDAVALAFHQSNLIFASSYYNGEILIWEINENIMTKIQKIANGDYQNDMFQMIEVRKSNFDTKDIHSVTCDSIQFIGDLIISRDMMGNIKISLITKIGVVIVKHLNYQQFENIWFLQLGYDPITSLIYLGNDNGEIFFWKKSGKDFRLINKHELAHKFLIRKVMIHSQAGIVLCVSDDGYAWIHEIKNKEFLKTD